MPVQFHPLALLHTIVVGAYYRKLEMKINNWRNNNRDYRNKSDTFKNWIAIHRANKNSNANLCELRRIINAVNTGIVSPREARNLSFMNKKILT